MTGLNDRYTRQSKEIAKAQRGYFRARNKNDRAIEDGDTKLAAKTAKVMATKELKIIAHGAFRMDVCVFPSSYFLQIMSDQVLTDYNNRVASARLELGWDPVEPLTR